MDGDLYIKHVLVVDCCSDMTLLQTANAGAHIYLFRFVRSWASEMKPIVGVKSQFA